MPVRRAVYVGPLLLALAPVAQAQEPTAGYHPWANEHVGPMEIDARELIDHPERYIQRPVQQPDFHSLDQWKAPLGADTPPDPANAGRTPEGWVQRGNVVLPSPVAEGELVDPDVAHGMVVIPGNEYPRKHTLFLNFNGGMLFSGADNSAENRSTLARQGVYPTYQGGEQTALSIIQAVQEDVAAYGILVTYAERPNPTVPYTMQMMGGSWTDTNIDSPAGGVAPGADCGALGQRHVVYTFASGGTSATQAANTASQEAGHAWGLDHSLNCGSVMSYCGSGNGVFSTECDSLCEVQCQGPNSTGCRLTHEEFCGVDSERQNEAAELSWIFGGNEPDMEPPSVEILEPADGLELEPGADVRIRTVISDNYGGYGWYYFITQDGVERANFVDFGRLVDEDYRAALNLGGLEQGEWVITVGAEDQFGHITEDTVTVVVGDPSASVDSSGGPSESGDTSELPTGAVGTGDGGEVDDGTTDRGCGCRSQGSSGGSGSWGLLMLGVFVVRRRSR